MDDTQGQEQEDEVHSLLELSDEELEAWRDVHFEVWLGF